MTETPELIVPDAAAWRDWLARNHARAEGVRVVLGYLAHEVPWLRNVAYGIAVIAVAGSVLVPVGGWLLRRSALRRTR